MFDVVEARAVERVYGRQRALHKVDLTLRAGEAVALLGPNGAGKSTLVGILAGLVQPSAGKVSYGGAETSDEIRGAIGVIAHESLCYGDLSARENLRFFARLYGVSDVDKRVDALIARVGLEEEAAARPARTYSRGMLQRLSVARALVHAPRLLLLDEPFTGLDRSGVEQLTSILAEERARGAMLLVVTHDFDAVATLTDRVVVLSRGKVALDEPLPKERGPAVLDALYRRGTLRVGT
jgi:heme exporter protein A